jgi:transposase
VIPIEVRFETEPGQQAQFDYGEERAPFGKVHFLALTLGWSRYLWCRYGFQQCQRRPNLSHFRRPNLSHFRRSNLSHFRQSNLSHSSDLN